MLNLGNIFPDFPISTTDGPFVLHPWLSWPRHTNSWCMFFSYSADFNPVCTTEMARLIELDPEFTRRNVKVIGLSCDDVGVHFDWLKDINKYVGRGDTDTFPFPVVEDMDREIADELGILEKDVLGADGKPVTARCVFIVDLDRKLRMSLTYPATCGRNFDEILRVIDSLQLTDRAKVATPVDWKMGEDCMVLPTVAEEDVPKLFPQGVTVVPVPSGKTYLRPVPKYKTASEGVYRHIYTSISGSILFNVPFL